MTTQPLSQTEIEELPDLERAHEGERQGLHPAWIVAILAAMGLVAYMLFDGTSSETYFFEVDQAVARGEKVAGSVIRVKGEVEKGSIVASPGQLRTVFRLTANGESMLVTYDKAMPDTFEEGVEVVAQGKVNDRLEMSADEVVVKCPSRYEDQPPTGHEAATGQRLPAGMTP